MFKFCGVSADNIHPAVSLAGMPVLQSMTGLKVCKGENNSEKMNRSVAKEILFNPVFLFIVGLVEA